MDKAKISRIRAIFGSLAFKIPLLFIIMLLFMMGAFLWVMDNYGKPLLLDLAKQQVRQSGESMVALVSERLAQTSALVTTMANTAEALPKTPELHRKVFKGLLDYEGTEHFLAGGGIWPEPNQFSHKQARRSFFWGRDSNNQFQYYHDYNLPDGNGYHQEEWYVPAAYLKPGHIYWSRSYMDPYSYQSMVTATAPMYRDDQFYGVATVDIKLEGLTELLAREAMQFGGYAYAVDRNGTFLSFPDSAISQTSHLDGQNKKVVEYLNIEQVSQAQPNIPNVMGSLSGLENISKLNNKLISKAQKLAQGSYQISLEEAHRIISVIADPFKHKNLGDTFLKELNVEKDPLLNTAVLINVFHVPKTYWKIVTVTPKSVVSATSEGITQEVLSSFMYVIGGGLFIGFLFIYMVLIRPLRSMFHQLNDETGEIGLMKVNQGGELGQLAQRYNERSKQLMALNTDLEQSVLKAQEAIVAKREFLANMSHEIRTPMNGVMGMLHLLMRNEKDPQNIHYLDVAKSSADSLIIIINDILDFSKIEAGKLELEYIEFDLVSLMSEFATAMAIQAENKGLQLILDMNEITYTWVKGDPGRIRQILTNLVSNAIKFTEEGEVLIKVSVHEDSDHCLQLQACVQDTGIGVNQEKQDMLFESFSQADASTTRQYGGTGLGLAICKQLCDLMSGEMWVTSELGKGCCFEFKLALDKSERSIFKTPRFDLTGRHLLVVDHNASCCNTLAQLLRNWGAQVSQAASSEEALELLGIQSPLFDLVFIDRHMPFVDGSELRRQIRLNRDWDSIPLIALTMKSQLENSTLAEPGFSASLMKPITPTNVRDVLCVVFEKESSENEEPLIDSGTASTQITPNTNKALKSASKTSAVRILLVEDNPLNCEVALSILEDLNFQADVAENGVQALRALVSAGSDSPYDLILMDCQMPEMDGYEATRKIRAGQLGIHNYAIVIIAMTANAMKGDREKCIEAGMDDYLTKPINVSVLQDTLEKWLER
jgi:signal transduction histidine kinase/DNA-binding response OmpR family regulator